MIKALREAKVSHRMDRSRQRIRGRPSKTSWRRSSPTDSSPTSALSQPHRPRRPAQFARADPAETHRPGRARIPIREPSCGTSASSIRTTAARWITPTPGNRLRTSRAHSEKKPAVEELLRTMPTAASNCSSPRAPSRHASRIPVFSRAVVTFPYNSKAPAANGCSDSCVSGKDHAALVVARAARQPHARCRNPLGTRGRLLHPRIPEALHADRRDYGMSLPAILSLRKLPEESA